MDFVTILSIFVLACFVGYMAQSPPGLYEETGSAVRLTQGGAVVSERLKG